MPKSSDKIFAVVDDDQLMLVTNLGQVIRIRVHGGEGDSIRVASRKTQGVRLFDVADDEKQDTQTNTIRELNLKIQKDDRINYSLLPLSDGLSFIQKK